MITKKELMLRIIDLEMEALHNHSAIVKLEKRVKQLESPEVKVKVAKKTTKKVK